MTYRWCHDQRILAIDCPINNSYRYQKCNRSLTVSKWNDFPCAPETHREITDRHMIIDIRNYLLICLARIDDSTWILSYVPKMTSFRTERESASLQTQEKKKDLCHRSKNNNVWNSSFVWNDIHYKSLWPSRRKSKWYGSRVERFSAAVSRSIYAVFRHTRCTKKTSQENYKVQ